MADQSFCLVEGIAKDVSVQIDDHYVPTDFLVIDFGEDEYDPPSFLEDHSTTLPRPLFILEQGRSISNSPWKRYATISIVII